MSAADQAEQQYHPVSLQPEESSHSSPSIPTRTIHVLQPGIADHGHGGEEEVGKCEIPLVEQVFDRSPTKPKRNNSPLRDHRRAEKEREKVQHFLAEIAVNKANSRAQQAVTRDVPAHVSVPQYHAAAGLSREPICRGIVLQDLHSYEAPPSNYVGRGQRHRLSTTDGLHFQYRQVYPHPVRSSSQRSSSPERFLPPRDDSRMPVSGGYSQHSLQAPLTRGPPPEQRACLMIQVEPGVRAPLRGSDETWQAIQDDFYVPALCVVCDTTLFVIQDAAYVLCPDCRTVNAVDGEFVDRIAAGVGLGFKYDDLMRWQREILEDRKNRTGARRVVTAEQQTRNDDGRSMSVYYGNS